MDDLIIDGCYIDRRLIGIIKLLNALGLETFGSCQGNDSLEMYEIDYVHDEDEEQASTNEHTKDENDYHSYCAFIAFREVLPDALIAILQKDERLNVYKFSVVELADHAYNREFAELVQQAVFEWIKSGMDRTRSSDDADAAESAGENID